MKIMINYLILLENSKKTFYNNTLNYFKNKTLTNLMLITKKKLLINIKLAIDVKSKNQVIEELSDILVFINLFINF